MISLCKELETKYKVLQQFEVDVQNQEKFDYPTLTKSVKAELFISGAITKPGKLYIASLEFGNTNTKKIKISKSSDSLGMLITSILNSIEQQEDFF